MKEFTKAERHEIYKLAYSIFLEKTYVTGMCTALIFAIEVKTENTVFHYMLKDMLPELFEIETASIKKYFNYWWDTNDRQVRHKAFETLIKQTSPDYEDLQSEPAAPANPQIFESSNPQILISLNLQIFKSLWTSIPSLPKIRLNTRHSKSSYFHTRKLN
jgi:hypothetical protein